MSRNRRNVPPFRDGPLKTFGPEHLTGHVYVVGAGGIFPPYVDGQVLHVVQGGIHLPGPRQFFDAVKSGEALIKHMETFGFRANDWDVISRRFSDGAPDAYPGWLPPFQHLQKALAHYKNPFGKGVLVFFSHTEPMKVTDLPRVADATGFNP